MLGGVRPILIPITRVGVLPFASCLRVEISVFDHGLPLFLFVNDISKTFLSKNLSQKLLKKVDNIPAGVTAPAGN
jgi:hypothetical protein